MTETLNLYTMEQLYRQPLLPIDFIVQDLLAPGLYILGGSPKVGKSWWALQLCLAVCRAQPFLGRKTRQAEVLYLALEDGPQRLHARALRMTEQAATGLYLCGQASVIGNGLEQQIQTALMLHPGIKLVIIDTLQKVRGMTKAGMTYGGDYQDAAALKALADSNGICLLVIHHLRKMGDEDPMNRLSGTNGLSGAADGILILAREKRQEKLTTITATGRDIDNIEEELDFCDFRWHKVTPMDKLQFDMMLGPLQTLLQKEGTFEGTATALAAKLSAAGALLDPAQLSKYIQSHEELLVRAGIQVESRRTSSQRTLRLWWNDGSDDHDGADTALLLPTTPSLPS